MLMLPIPKDRISLQECVGDNSKQPQWATANCQSGEEDPIHTVDVEVRTLSGGGCIREPMVKICPGEAAPIKLIGGRVWSPGTYRALRLIGKSLDVAWEKAFLHPLTFNY